MTTFHRVKNWEQRLTEEIRRSQDMEFNLRTNNCGLFVARCLEAITGERVGWEVWRYTVCATMQDLGFKEQPILSARTGDILSVPTPGHETAFAIAVQESAIAASKYGLEKIPLDRAQHCWRVG